MMIHAKPSCRHVVLKTFRPSKSFFHKVIMGNCFVPWISLHTEFEVITPMLMANSRPNFVAWHMVVVAVMILGPVRFNVPRNRRHDVVGTAMLRKEKLDTCSGRLLCLDENKPVFVRDNHRQIRYVSVCCDFVHSRNCNSLDARYDTHLSPSQSPVSAWQRILHLNPLFADPAL